MDLRTRLRNDLMATVDLPYGSETVDQLTHALQAGTLAARSGARPELVAAALLHDIGRSPAVADELPGVPHERIGASYCRHHLGHDVGWLVGAHVLAKRALVTTEPGYVTQLSPASVRSLAVQGGPADEAEIIRFLRHPLASEAIALRRWDDKAKQPGATTLPLDALLDTAMLARSAS